MQEKITVPKRVADSIKTLQVISGGSNFGVIQRASKGLSFGTNAGIVYRHFNGDMDALMYALVNGYTVEQSPEDKLREYYQQLRESECKWLSKPMNSGCPPQRHMIEAINETLEILGIKIDGINA